MFTHEAFFVLPIYNMDYYVLLEIERGASQGEISAAYKKLARKYHPDAQPREASVEAVEITTEKFKKCGQAYETLSDPHLRARYDNKTRYTSRPKPAPKPKAKAKPRNRPQQGGWSVDHVEADYSKKNDWIDVYSKEYMNEEEIDGTYKRVLKKGRYNVWQHKSNPYTDSSFVDPL